MNHFKTLALGAALLLSATIETQATCVPCPGISTFYFTCITNPGKPPVCTAPSIKNADGTWTPSASPALKTQAQINLISNPKIVGNGSPMQCTYNTSYPGVFITLTNSRTDCKFNKNLPCGKMNPSQFQCD